MKAVVQDWEDSYRIASKEVIMGGKVARWWGLGTASTYEQFDDSWKEHIKKSIVKCLLCRRI